MGWRRVAEQELPTARARRPGSYLQAYADGVNAYLDGRSRRREMSLEYTVLGLQAADYRVETGRRWTRWPGSRRWPGTCAATTTTSSARARLSAEPHAASRSTSSTRAYPYAPHPPILSDAGLVGRRLRADAAPAAPATPDPPPVATRGAAPATQAPRALRRACPALLGQRRRHRLQLLGGLRRAHHDRQAAAGQRPAPRRRRSRASGTRWACTAARVGAGCPFDVAGFTFSGLPGVVIGHNQHDRLGLHQPRPRRHRLLPRAGRRATPTCATAS